MLRNDESLSKRSLLSTPTAQQQSGVYITLYTKPASLLVAGDSKGTHDTRKHRPSGDAPNEGRAETLHQTPFLPIPRPQSSPTVPLRPSLETPSRFLLFLVSFPNLIPHFVHRSLW